MLLMSGIPVELLWSVYVMQLLLAADAIVIVICGVCFELCSFVFSVE